MGAFGAALIARERYDGISDSSMLSIDKINSLHMKLLLQDVKEYEQLPFNYK